MLVLVVAGGGKREVCPGHEHQSHLPPGWERPGHGEHGGLPPIPRHQSPQGDLGAGGQRLRALHDGIICDAQAPEVSIHLSRQLLEGGAQLLMVCLSGITDAHQVGAVGPAFL